MIPKGDTVGRKHGHSYFAVKTGLPPNRLGVLRTKKKKKSKKRGS
jgi:hypothetical protein